VSLIDSLTTAEDAHLFIIAIIIMGAYSAPQNLNLLQLLSLGSVPSPSVNIFLCSIAVNCCYQDKVNRRSGHHLGYSLPVFLK